MYDSLHIPCFQKKMPGAINFNTTIGAFIIAVVISAAYGYISGNLKHFDSPRFARLFGVMFIQTLYYFLNYGSDGPLLRILVRFSASTLNSPRTDTLIGVLFTVRSTRPYSDSKFVCTYLEEQDTSNSSFNFRYLCHLLLCYSQFPQRSCHVRL